MKRFGKRLLSLLCAALVFGAVYMCALETDSVATTEHINTMLRLIDNQNFENMLGNAYVKEKVKFLLYDSDYAAQPGDRRFPYPNNGSFHSKVKEGGTDVALRGSTKGCMLYARYANTVVNGSDPANYRFLEQLPGEVTEEGVKNFLLTYGQAGEHLRIDSTHSVAFLSGDANGFYYFNYINDGLPVIRMNYMTYADFASKYNYIYPNSGDSIANIYSIWLYDSNGNTNRPYTEQPALPGDAAHVTPAPVCPHAKYSASGFCKACGEEFPLKVTAVEPTEYTVIKTSPKRLRPYATWQNHAHVGLGDKVTVIGMAYNSYGNLWYKVNYKHPESWSKNGETFWIFSENVVRLNEIDFTLLEPTNIGTSTLTLNATCSYTLRRPDRIILRVGTSKKNMKKLDSDEITFTKNPFDIWYNLSGIEQDVVYYYQIIAEIDNEPYAGLQEHDAYESKIDTFMIPSAKNQPAETTTVTKPDTDPIDKVTDAMLDSLPTVQWTVQPHERKTQTSAQMKATCSYTGTRPTYVALYIGLSNDPNSMWQYGYDAINFTKNPFDVWYDVSGMAANTIYYYQFRAEVNGVVYNSEIRSITTMDTSVGDKAMDALIGALPPVFTVKPHDRLTQTSVRLQASCSYTGTRPTYVALYLGLSKDPNSMWQVGYDAINFTKNPFDVWYDVSGMAANTVYYYQFRTEVNGVVYSSDIYNVTTMNTETGKNVINGMLGALS